MNDIYTHGNAYYTIIYNHNNLKIYAVGNNHDTCKII